MENIYHVTDNNSRGTTMEITITGVKTDGSHFSQKIDSEIKELNLSSNQLKEIDLIPLKTCTKLTELDLGDNDLQTIILTPLRKCTKIEKLRLFRNQLQFINLTPLHQCTKLERLHIIQYTNSSKTETTFPELIWTLPIQDSSSLPDGLKEFSHKLKKAWKRHKKTEEETGQMQISKDS